jgi:cytoskeletal protein CcmA (bactofilin family)
MNSRYNATIRILDPVAGTHAPAPDAAPTPSLEIEMGRSLPPTARHTLPMLQQDTSLEAATETGDGGIKRSVIAQGMRFEGVALLRSPCIVAGQFTGNITQANDAEVAVVVAETGRVQGDIFAHKISVRGRTDGLLDAAHGVVSLHDSAQVNGRIRYGRIQVNGANLNATLERVALPRDKT